MRYLKFKVSNYKSFLESTELRLAPGINVIVGQNNSGKTALLEAMSFTFADRPHRSVETMPTRTTALPPYSSATYDFEVDAVEVRELMSNPPGAKYVAVQGDQPSSDADTVSSILNGDVVFRTTFGPSIGFANQLLAAWPVVSAENALALRCHSTPTGVVVEATTLHRPHLSDFVAVQMAHVFRSRVYLFQAERMTLSQSGMGPDPNLRSNAINLPQVLNFLSTDNPSRFERFLSYVRDVFPQIHRITVPPLSPSETRILVWTQNSDPERNDLAIPLNESGTGIGQVLAMLYVLVTSDSPRVILIDEPQSFLHPSAIRKLLETFAAHPMHQYIITTHSPTALASSRLASLYALDDGRS
jgi:energy-coupling factor transporter ATP-binding protein EcfA2